jgi:hypothetical protein
VAGAVFQLNGADGRASEHELTPVACVSDDGQVAYPG